MGAMSNKFVPRLYVDADIFAGATLCLSARVAHYLRTVLRLHLGAEVFLFNAQHGQFIAKITALNKSQVDFAVGRCVREPYMGADITLLCSVIQKDAFRFVIEKGTELGVRSFQPIITAHTNAPKIRLDKVREYALHATQQCERLDIPQIHDAEKMSTAMRRWRMDIPIVHACERGGQQIPEIADTIAHCPFAVLTGPEGGFSPEEHAWLAQQPHIHAVSLGPRLMRAETAVVAALSALQCLAGDWIDDITYVG